jgi:hypothetical protein
MTGGPDEMTKDHAHRSFLLATSLATLLATSAMGKERPVDREERTKLAAAVAAEGCPDGKMEYDDDDGHYEVDDVQCPDGRKYDFKFDGVQAHQKAARQLIFAPA